MDFIDNKDAQGKNASPLLPEGKKNYLIDIDGTICEDVPNEEADRMWDCEELPGAKQTINAWYAEGHIITFFTARTEENRAATEHWLREHGFQYHGILFGKPRGGNYHWIDDRSVRATQFLGNFTQLVKRTTEIEVFPDK